MRERLDIYEFGRQLLQTNDLDPVYVVLYRAKLERPKLLRWLLAYWCLYHVGTASWICESIDESDYWDRLRIAAGSNDYPRSSERRHYRGLAATRSVEWLARQGLSALFQPLIGVDTQSIDLMRYVMTWVGFGPWIAFKVADMIERLGLSRVRFDSSAIHLFDSPKQGAALLWEAERSFGAKPGEAEPWAIRSILHRLGSVKAPPRYERVINVQEVETILCKWKSHMKGHYCIGEDIEAVRNGLLRFARCRTSQRLITGGKVGGLW